MVYKRSNGYWLRDARSKLGNKESLGVNDGQDDTKSISGDAGSGSGGEGV